MCLSGDPNMKTPPGDFSCNNLSFLTVACCPSQFYNSNSSNQIDAAPLHRTVQGMNDRVAPPRNSSQRYEGLHSKVSLQQRRTCTMRKRLEVAAYVALGVFLGLGIATYRTFLPG